MAYTPPYPSLDDLLEQYYPWFKKPVLDDGQKKLLSDKLKEFKATTTKMGSFSAAAEKAATEIKKAVPTKTLKPVKTTAADPKLYPHWIRRDPISGFMMLECPVACSFTKVACIFERFVKVNGLDSLSDSFDSAKWDEFNLAPIVAQATEKSTESVKYFVVVWD